VHVQVQSGQIIQPISESDIALVVPKTETSAVRLEYDVPGMVNGPVASGDSLGQVIVLNGGDVLTKVDAICPLRAGDSPRRTGDTISVSNNVTSTNSGPAESAGLPLSANPK
jgi:Penicillin-binding protein 5, C-terminal domain